MQFRVRALLYFLVSFSVLNCTDEEKMPVQGKVQFAIDLASKQADGGRVQTTSFPDGSYISLSIEASSGTPVYTNEHVALIQLGDGYVTVPLNLTAGSYRLTDFMIMSSANVVLFATPKEGSDLAGLVEDPLPVNFDISIDGILNLSVQVVDVDQQSIVDFGYASFGVEVVGGDFAVSLVVGDGDELTLASGKLELYQGNDLVYEQNLDAKVNGISFKGDPDITYKLFVIKEGHAIKTREFVWHALVDELNGKPLTFVMEPAFTILAQHHAVFDDNLPMTFNLGLTGTPNTAYRLTIDWGDGTVDVIRDFYRKDGSSPTQFYLHFYSESLAGTRRAINVTGDISNSTLFYLMNPLPLSIHRIDIRQLVNLETFDWNAGGTAKADTPENLDISGNPKLRALGIGNSNLQSLDISNHSLLTLLNLRDSEISNENVNEVIMDLPEREGQYGYAYFSFGKSSDSDQQNLAILTPESKAKLILLRDTYGWNIQPNP